MCVHYTIINDQIVAQLVRRVMGEKVVVASWKVGPAWPKAHMEIVTQRNGERAVESMRWGVRAPYDNGDNWNPVVNARDDKLNESRMWSDALATRRCLAPADGFFEWVGPKGAKYETFLTRPGGEPFFFAALWNPDRQGGGAGYAIVTTSPNELMAAIPHDRMPAILDAAEAEAWIGDKPADVMHLLRPFPATLQRQDQAPPERKPKKSKVTKTDLQNGELNLF